MLLYDIRRITSVIVLTDVIGVNFLKKIQIELVSIHKPCKFYS